MMKTIMNTTKKDTKADAGFTLVELIGIMTVIAILAGVAAIPLLGLIEATRFKAERDTLAMLANEARASFRQDDYTMNLSMLEMDLPGTLPISAPLIGTADPIKAAVAPATFDAVMPVSGEAFDENAWYARLARLRGQSVTDWTDGGDLDNILYNAYHRRRLMIVGPYEANQQRYIILSFMFQDGPNLPVPPSTAADHGRIVAGASSAAYETWFNIIYNHQWGDKAEALPGSWAATTGTNWLRTERNRNYMQRVIAQRIVQPRYTVTVNNNSHSYSEPVVAEGIVTGTRAVYSDRVYVYANMRYMGDWNYSGLGMTVMGRDHDTSSSYNSVMIFPTQIDVTPPRDAGILEGRRVVIKRDKGTHEDNGNQHGATLIDSFHINQNTTYTAQ